VGEKHVAPLRVLGFVECQRQTLWTLTKYLPKNIENICNIKYIALELPYYIFSYDTMYVIGVMNIGNFFSYSLLNFAKFWLQLISKHQCNKNRGTTCMFGRLKTIGTSCINWEQLRSEFSSTGYIQA
jgi:hypothetical protein